MVLAFETIVARRLYDVCQNAGGFCTEPVGD
jgi:hypothetical protein